jgi:hypothetical protein
MKIHLKREWQLAEGNGRVCTTADGKKEVTQHHRPPIPQKIAWKLATATRTTTSHFPLFNLQTIHGIWTHKTERPCNNSPMYMRNPSANSQRYAWRNSLQPTQTQLLNHTAESKERSQTSRRGGLKTPPDLQNRTKTSKNPYLHLPPAYIYLPGRSLSWKP